VNFLRAISKKTYAYPFLTPFHNSWYINGVKVIPDDLYDLITPVALAHWVIGDGAKHGNGLCLHTQGFTDIEVVKEIT